MLTRWTMCQSHPPPPSGAVVLLSCRGSWTDIQAGLLIGILGAVQFHRCLITRVLTLPSVLVSGCMLVIGIIKLPQQAAWVHWALSTSAASMHRRS